jgi:hypothetical protein
MCTVQNAALEKKGRIIVYTCMLVDLFELPCETCVCDIVTEAHFYPGISGIPPMTHIHLHLNITLMRKTSGPRLGTFK